MVNEAMNLPQPRVTPADFSKYQELRKVVKFVGDNFERQIPELRNVGFVGTVDRLPDTVSIRIERSGETVYSLDVRKARMGDATARQYFDREAGCPKVKIIDFSLLGLTGPADLTMTATELFEAIWTRMVQQLESLR